MVMAVSQVRIHGKGHLLCLSRTLQASLEEESFADVRLVVFKSTSSNDNYHPQPYLRANRAVLAAASPIFARLLKESITDEETTLVFEGYQYENITNMLQYIYTGQTTITSQEEKSFKCLLNEMQIGNFTNLSNNGSTNTLLSEEVPPVKDISLKHLQLETQQAKAESLKKINTTLINKEKSLYSKSLRKLPVYPSRPLLLSKEEVTLKDPQADQHCNMHNPDVIRNGSLLEKSGSKFSLLSEANADTAGNLVDYPRMADRLGIYFDPQLFSYYRSLVRSLPPIRIFLHIDDDKPDSDSEIVETSYLKKSTIVYTQARRRDKAHCQRKSFASNRLPVKTMCCVNGKTHVILDGQPIFIDPSIKAIDYPSTERDEGCEQDHSQYEEENFAEQEVESEVRRKRFLLTTLNRLKKDHSRAKKMAHHILKVSSKKQDTNLTSGETSETPKKTPPQRMVVCEVCGKLISASWIRVHFANHQGEKNYLCEHCGRSFASANLLKSHVHYQHNSQLDMIKCDVCGKPFTKKSRLEIHMRIHSDTRPYRCPVFECGKRFHTNGNLRKHSFVHTGEKPHKCDICDKSFAQSTNLRLHMRTHQQLLDEGGKSGNQRIRKPEAVFSCEFCPMTFSRIRHFNAHRATHTGEQTTLPCTICQQQFIDINELKQHKRKEHPGTVHQCPLCDKSFFKKTAMQRHQATHTQDPYPKPNFPCQHCNSQFTTAAARTVHERTHTGERPFKCTTCSKSFTSKYNFRQHLRMHSEERPFKCTQCNKAFRQPQHLRAHAYTHKNQDEPVPCPICGKMFRNKILVMSHKRIHKLTKADQLSETQGSLQQQEVGIQLVDSNMGFVNILVLADNTELS